MKLFILLLLTSSACYASEYRGEGTASTEAQASERAWTQAVTQMGISEHPEIVELTSYSSERLKGSEAARTIVVHIEKLDLSSIKEVSTNTEQVAGGYKVTKVLSGLMTAKKLKEDDKPEPFHYAQTLGKPKIRIGMSKAEVLLKFGAPSDAGKNVWSGNYELIYEKKFCKDPGSGRYCAVYLENDKVSGYYQFKYEYTEDLK